MFKPTKPQHIVNKNYADNNSSGGDKIAVVNVNVPFFISNNQAAEAEADKTLSEIVSLRQQGYIIVANMTITFAGAPSPTYMTLVFDAIGEDGAYADRTHTELSDGHIGFTCLALVIDNNGATVKGYVAAVNTTGNN